MQITTELIDSQPPVSIIALEGDLDGSNYTDLIAQAKGVYQTGTHFVLLDMERCVL
ncbi:MAG: hypothetical protein HC806_08545 [Anaerolineae bacterium]|nr:hypothetical protein [Anaerolineae bacterium]